MEWYGYVLLVAGLLIVAFIFFLIGMLYRKKVAEREIGSAETEATRIINEAIKGGQVCNVTLNPVSEFVS